MRQNDSRFFFATLRGGLQDRTLLAPFPTAERTWQIIYLRSGAVSIWVSPDDVRTYEAPCILSLPHDPQRQVSLLAGSAGAALAVNDFGMTTALGSRPEAIELRVMMNSFVSLPLHDLPDQEEKITQALAFIAEETAQQAPGQLVVIEAQLRCLIILLWRACYLPQETTSSDGPQTILLRKFRQLVETHFRQRWRVADYAKALSTTPDRLHSVASHNLGRKPLDLIHERSHREAIALLDRSSMTLDQIAAYLGFKTTAQFSAFFRKMEGHPPGRFRAAKFARQTATTTAQGSGFDDWP